MDGEWEWIIEIIRGSWNDDNHYLELWVTNQLGMALGSCMYL